ncbi:hypothetical protein MC885_019294 [Smutsia gigantea]|nr:hypothetical protein MC885_019294 [Smutsia gigantea]
MKVPDSAVCPVCGSTWRQHTLPEQVCPAAETAPGTSCCLFLVFSVNLPWVFTLNPIQAVLVPLSSDRRRGSLGGVYTKRNLRGKWDTREAVVQFQVHEHDGHADLGILELPAGGDGHPSVGRDESRVSDTQLFFHYSQGQVYAGNYPPFKDRISWAGDLDKRDASINIENMQFIHNGTYICDVKNPPDIVVQPGHIRLHVVEKETLPALPGWVLVGIIAAVILGLSLLVSMVLAVLYRRKNSKQDYASCSTSESVSPVKQAPRKCPSDTEGLAKGLPSGSHQVTADRSSAPAPRSMVWCSVTASLWAGRTLSRRLRESRGRSGPVIYAQLDHSGGHPSDKINKSESVVYADIRKN